MFKIKHDQRSHLKMYKCTLWDKKKKNHAKFIFVMMKLILGLVKHEFQLGLKKKKDS